MASHIWAVLVVVFSLDIGVTRACGAHWSLQIGDTKTFTSPNYPNPYPGGTDCRWTASTPKNSIVNVLCPDIDVLRGKLACIDLFYISGHEKNGRCAPICGTGSLNITTNNFEVYFTPENIFHNSTKGFTCMVTVLENITTNEHSCCGCGRNSHHNRIVGGDKAEVHEWPWQVALHATVDKGVFGCGGSLISPNWILTAAHCVDGASKIVAYLGEHAKHNNTETNKTVEREIDMDNAIIHTGYNDKGLHRRVINDIAVLKLSNPIEYTDGVSPVCLPTNLRNKRFDGENAAVTGWGVTSYKGNASDTLLELTLPVISNIECGKMMDKTIWNDQICTYKDKKGPCQGDSGGSLVWLDESGRYQQIGIVSQSKAGCANKDNPTVYTRITSFIDWIKEKTNINICST